MKVIFLLIVAFNLWALDNQIEKCGQYQIEGRIKEHKKQFYFVTNEDSNTELRIAIGSNLSKKNRKYLGQYIEALIEIQAPCRYRCFGAFKSFKNRVQYQRGPKIFRPTQQLKRETHCK